jgi:hypothetical protein
MPTAARLRRLRLAAAVLAIGGLLLLHRLCTARELPRVRIDGIRPTMNFGVVCVEGRVAEKPRLRRHADRIAYAGLRIDDGTGRLTAVAYGRQAERLAGAGALPAAGEMIRVCGALDIRADGSLRLRIQNVAQLKRRPPAEAGDVRP